MYTVYEHYHEGISVVLTSQQQQQALKPNLEAKREHSDDHFKYKSKWKLPQSRDGLVTDRSTDDVRCHVSHVQPVVAAVNTQSADLLLKSQTQHLKKSVEMKLLSSIKKPGWMSVVIVTWVIPVNYRTWLITKQYM